MWRRLRNAHVLLHVPAKGDSPVSLAMTHMRWAHGQSGHESTDYTLSVVHLVGGWEAWPIDRCSNKDVGRRERETPTPCVRTKQAPIKNTTKTTRDVISQSHIVLCNTQRLGERQAIRDTLLSKHNAKLDKHCNTTRFKTNRNKTRPRNTNKHKQCARWCQTAFCARIRNFFDVCFVSASMAVRLESVGAGEVSEVVAVEAVSIRLDEAALPARGSVVAARRVRWHSRVWKLDSTVSNRRSHTVSEADYLKLTVLFHDLVKKRVPLNVRLASAIATK